MVFAYRSGKNPISAKVWRKLEAAELAAGLSPPGSGNAQNSVKAKDLPPPEERNYSSILREESPLERIRQMQKQIQEPPAGAKLDGFLERIAIALERLVEIEEERNRKS